MMAAAPGHGKNTDAARAAADPALLVSPWPGVELRLCQLSTGVTLRVATAGPPAGRPLLFLHGWPEFWFSWRHQLTYFGAHGFRVLAPDLRGYGGSDCPTAVEAYSVHQIAADTIALLQAHGLRKCILCGHDWGAILTWQLALLHPEWFPVVAALSVPTTLRRPTDVDPITRMEKAFGRTGDPDQMFFYILYHHERLPVSRDYGPAELEYDADPRDFIRAIWTDETVPKATPTKPAGVSQLRRDGGLRAHGYFGGTPKRLPLWLSQADLEYVVENFKCSGFHGGLCYYRNLRTNFRSTPQLIGRRINQPALFLTGENDAVRRMGQLLGGGSAGGGGGDSDGGDSDGGDSDGGNGDSGGGGNGDPQRRWLESVCDDLRVFCILRADAAGHCTTTTSAGHWIQQEQPDAVNAVLLKFFEDTRSEFDTAPGGAGGLALAKL